MFRISDILKIYSNTKSRGFQMCLWHNQFAVNYIKNTFQASADYEMVSLLVFPEAAERRLAGDV